MRKFPFLMNLYKYFLNIIYSDSGQVTQGGDPRDVFHVPDEIDAFHTHDDNSRGRTYDQNATPNSGTVSQEFPECSVGGEVHQIGG